MRASPFTLDSCAGSRDNNLDVMRLVAAALVIVTHSFPITGGAECWEPLAQLTSGRLTLGGMAVGLFFCAGGFLIARSCERKSEPKSYFSARAFRIYPQLIVLTLITMFIVGPVVTSLDLASYFSQPSFFEHGLNALAIPRYVLPGVFESNPYPGVINGALWTLPAEILCYILCWLGYKLTRYNKQVLAIFSGLIVALTAVYLVFFSPLALSAVRAVLLFYVGILLYVFREKIVIDHKLGCLSLVLLLVGIYFQLDTVVMILVFPYCIMWIAYAWPRKFLWLSSFGELSYGMYLWGFLIQQLLVYFGSLYHIDVVLHPFANSLLAIALALICGYLGDHLVDRPLALWRAKNKA